MSQTPHEAGPPSSQPSASQASASQPAASANGIPTGASKSPDPGASGQARFHGCSKISDYELLGKLGEGTFGEVHKAKSLKTGKLVALKKILMHNEKDGFPITALREIKLLKLLSHPNVLKLEEMAVEPRKGEGRKKAIMYMVTPYMDHDLAGLLENPAVRITEPQIKCYMLQLLEGVRYLHANQILHRDMKAANLLINNRGILQIADFGLARPYDDPPPEAGKGGGEARREYTCLVVTRFYRPPELLLQLRRYTTAIDLWGVGCVFGEMFKGRPILAGSSDLNQLVQIFDLVGSPTEETMPGWSRLPGCEGVKTFHKSFSSLSRVFKEQGSGVISLLSELLKLDWRTRINAMDALKHPYFTSPPLPAKPHELPQFEESHELDRRMYRSQQRALPPAPAGGTVGVGPQGEWAQGGGPPNGDRPSHVLPARGHRHGPATRGHNHTNHSRDGRPPPPAPTGDQPRRPAWQTNDSRTMALPPRPPPTSTGWNARPSDSQADASRPRNGPARAGLPQSAGDFYIPNYHNGAERPRGMDRDGSRGERGRHHDHSGHEGGRRRSRSPMRHDQVNGERSHDPSRDRYRR